MTEKREKGEDRKGEENINKDDEWQKEMLEEKRLQVEKNKKQVFKKEKRGLRRKMRRRNSI
jgi:hypothetical protein